jgi:hypothetical protein
MKFGKPGVLALSLAALAAVLSGCVVFDGPITAKQAGKKPKVKVKFTLCRSDPETDCSDFGNYDDCCDSQDVRILLGFRVPKGTKAPREFATKSIDVAQAGVSETFARSPSYKRELNQVAPRGPKFKYFGYESGVIFSDDYEAADFKVAFELAKDFKKKRFKVRPVVGFIDVTDEQPADTEIDCGDNPFERPDTGGRRICIDSPSPSEFDNIKAKIKPKRR